jgi:molybdopterin-containing oxidoreductase family iron-sulfur binding subunit
MQEIPHPVTKLAWNSWVELSFATAEKLGVVFGDLLAISTPAGRVEASVFPRGGIRDDAIALPIGQGHRVGHYASMAGDGAPGEPRGANVIELLPAKADAAGSRVWLGANAELAPTGHFRRLVLSQWTDNQRQRGLARQVSLAALTGEEEHGGHHGGHHDEPPHSFDASFDANPEQPYRWGMTIDNDRCNGCGACIAACYIENNVAVIGEQQSLQHREMTWLRIERYVGEGDVSGGAERRPIPDRERLGELDVRYVPLPCQHCGAAPCEGVCPTLATYHNVEGVNAMVYNRCAGTRYCANN